MIARTLPASEWPRLEGTLLESVWRTFDPAYVEVLVVEEAGRIVATAAILAVPHVECVSTTSVASGRALWTAIRERVAALGASGIWCACTDAPMRRLLTRHAQPVPGEHFIMAMTPCRPS